MFYERLRVCISPGLCNTVPARAYYVGLMDDSDRNYRSRPTAANRSRGIKTNILNSRVNTARARYRVHVSRTNENARIRISRPNRFRCNRSLFPRDVIVFVTRRVIVRIVGEIDRTLRRI